MRVLEIWDPGPRTPLAPASFTWSAEEPEHLNQSTVKFKGFKIKSDRMFSNKICKFCLFISIFFFFLQLIQLNSIQGLYCFADCSLLPSFHRVSLFSLNSKIMKIFTSCFRRQKSPTPTLSIVEPSSPEVPVIENVDPIPEIQPPIPAPSTFVSHYFCYFMLILCFRRLSVHLLPDGKLKKKS